MEASGAAASSLMIAAGEPAHLVMLGAHGVPPAYRTAVHAYRGALPC